MMGFIFDDVICKDDFSMPRYCREMIGKTIKIRSPHTNVAESQKYLADVVKKYFNPEAPIFGLFNRVVVSIPSSVIFHGKINGICDYSQRMQNLDFAPRYVLFFFSLKKKQTFTFGGEHREDSHGIVFVVTEQAMGPMELFPALNNVWENLAYLHGEKNELARSKVARVTVVCNMGMAASTCKTIETVGNSLKFRQEPNYDDKRRVVRFFFSTLGHLL